MKIKDAISNIMNFKIPDFILKNYVVIIVVLFIVYILYRLQQLGGKYLARERYIEGLTMKNYIHLILIVLLKT